MCTKVVQKCIQILYKKVHVFPFHQFNLMHYIHVVNIIADKVLAYCLLTCSNIHSCTACLYKSNFREIM